MEYLEKFYYEIQWYLITMMIITTIMNLRLYRMMRDEVMFKIKDLHNLNDPEFDEEGNVIDKKQEPHFHSADTAIGFHNMENNLINKKNFDWTKQNIVLIPSKKLSGVHKNKDGTTDIRVNGDMETYHNINLKVKKYDKDWARRRVTRLSFQRERRVFVIGGALFNTEHISSIFIRNNKKVPGQSMIIVKFDNNTSAKLNLTSRTGDQLKLLNHYTNWSFLNTCTAFIIKN